MQYDLRGFPGFGGRFSVVLLAWLVSLLLFGAAGCWACDWIGLRLHWMLFVAGLLRLLLM